MADTVAVAASVICLNCLVVDPYVKACYCLGKKSQTLVTYCVSKEGKPVTLRGPNKTQCANTDYLFN